jgi:hypothetical protein
MPLKDKNAYNEYMRVYKRGYRKRQAELIEFGKKYRELLLKRVGEKKR